MSAKKRRIEEKEHSTRSKQKRRVKNAFEEFLSNSHAVSWIAELDVQVYWTLSLLSSAFARFFVLNPETAHWRRKFRISFTKEFCFYPLRIWKLLSELHREDGPAFICQTEANPEPTLEQWLKHGKLHRIDGPAQITRSSHGLGETSRAYYLEGKLHRIGGPANEFQLKRVNFFQVHKEQWFEFGIVHRSDGPALTEADGSKHWLVNGKYHRLDGPAIEDQLADVWYVDGKLHRLDGPAVVVKTFHPVRIWMVCAKDGTMESVFLRQSEWWINGVLQERN